MDDIHVTVLWVVSLTHGNNKFWKSKVSFEESNETSFGNQVSFDKSNATNFGNQKCHLRNQTRQISEIKSVI